uniref:Uncharacterized protein n=1 Tax=Romanomermis culicivorax TaxID=13658 RepID=A0A915L7Q0_ROMCU
MYDCKVVEDKETNTPKFVIHAIESAGKFTEIRPKVEIEDATIVQTSSPTEAWNQILAPIEALRRQNAKSTLKLFPKFLFGEFLYGFVESSVRKMIESLPGVETLIGYEFKFGRNPLMDLPLAVNPSGCARCEPRFRTYLKRGRAANISSSQSHHQTMSLSAMLAMSGLGTLESQQALLWASLSGRPPSTSAKWSQYRRMKQEWKSNIYLGRSKIQGLGLYAKKPIEMNTIVIEYIGEIIRNEVAERREKLYQENGRGVYMFRLDHERVVDATMCGGLARYINHSCDPNCTTESIQLNNGESKIVIIACRPISEGEELCYDYQFDLEDDTSKIQCLCGAPNCQKWMN